MFIDRARHSTPEHAAITAGRQSPDAVLCVPTAGRRLRTRDHGPGRRAAEKREELATPRA
jgi:hypothetical protein